VTATSRPAKIEKRKQQIEESVQRYLSALDTADRTMPLLEFGPRSAHLKDKLSAPAQADASHG
jgi:hypothetical protein